MYLTRFMDIFPEQATAEVKVLHVGEGAPIPADEYALLDAYCLDPDCHCRRVMLNVVRRAEPQRYLASISFAFDRDASDSGPYLDPLNPQSEYAQALLELLAVHLEDPAVIGRFQAHYYQMKGAAADPDHPACRLRRAGSIPPMKPRTGSRPRKRR